MFHINSLNKKLIGAIFSSVTLFSLPAVADQEKERANLEQIENEIAQLQQMVSIASRETIPTQRVNFRYDWLMNDLEIMRRGIKEHTNAPLQPRKIEPLKGDYRN